MSLSKFFGICTDKTRVRFPVGEFFWGLFFLFSLDSLASSSPDDVVKV